MPKTTKRGLSVGARVGIVVLVVLVLFGLTLVTPAPSTWGADASTKPQSVTVGTSVSRNIAGDYAVGVTSVSAKPMTLLVWGSIAPNFAGLKPCPLCPDPRTLTATLLPTDPSNNAGPSVVSKNVGRFQVWGGTKSVSVTFTDERPGPYTLRLVVTNPQGGEDARYEGPVYVLPGGT